MIQLKILPISPTAVFPTKGTEHAACFDLTASDISEAFNDYVIYRTGLKVEIPEGHVMLIYGRSGLAFNKNMRLANCVGVIDSDYRGELMVKLTKDGPGDFTTWPLVGDRIAQFMIVPVPEVQLELVSELSDTARGTGGMGSTGR